MAYKNDGPVIAGTGALYTVNKSGKDSGISSLREANFIESECGCGIDCCNNRIVLLDQTLGTKVFIQVINGVFTVTDAAGDVLVP
jgi:hypothetical protein